MLGDNEKEYYYDWERKKDYIAENRIACDNRVFCGNVCSE